MDLANSEALSNPFVHSRKRQRSKWILAGGASEALLGSGQPLQPSQHPLNSDAEKSRSMERRQTDTDGGRVDCQRREVATERQNDRGAGVYNTG